MGKKFGLNILYSIGLFLAVITAFWGYRHQQYVYLVAAVFVGALFIVLKVRLLKEIKNSQRP